jgi:hypothetical protein
MSRRVRQTVRAPGDVKDLMSRPTGDLGGLGAGASGRIDFREPVSFSCAIALFQARIIIHHCTSDLKGDQGQSRSGT